MMGEYRASSSICFFFNDTATTEIYTLSLHDALPISGRPARSRSPPPMRAWPPCITRWADRKSTRLNSSHLVISYAVFCLKKTISVVLNDLVGQIFAMFVLTVAAAEAAIGLAILVVYFRNRGTIQVEDIRMMRG